jgi:CheY-like chemotaxis protein
MTTPIRVLLVEDNEGDAYLTRQTLEAGKLFVQIDVVSDGLMAVEYLTGRIESPAALPDLILLDLNLPKMSGQEVLAEIHRRPVLARIPVVVLTSSDAERDIATSYELGANCYVTKPVGLTEFQSIVRSVESFWFTVVKLP